MRAISEQTNASRGCCDSGPSGAPIVLVMCVERVTDKQPVPAPADLGASSGRVASRRGELPDAELQTITEWPGRWWVLHTKPRQEKCLFAALQTIDVRSYLPLTSGRRCRGRRSTAASVPLFPGYVFLCGSDHDRIAALRTDRVANVLDVPDQTQLREELAAIERVVSDAKSVGLYPGLKEGARCPGGSRLAHRAGGRGDASPRSVAGVRRGDLSWAVGRTRDRSR